MKTQYGEKGFVLTGVMMLLLIAALVGGAFLFSARNSFATVDQWKFRDECLLGMQSSVGKVRHSIHTNFIANTISQSIDSLDALAGMNVTRSVVWQNTWAMQPYALTATVTTASGPAIKDPANNRAEITITNEAWVTHRGVTRRVRETTLYVYSQGDDLAGSSPVFDNVFFVEAAANYGATSSGVNVDFNGDVYSNRDIEFQWQAAARMNGDLYAGGINQATKAWRYDEWGSAYSGQKVGGVNIGNRVRPASNTDYNASNTNTVWPQGYKGTHNKYDYQPQLVAPFIGPLEEYQTYAVSSGGTVKTGSTTIVNAVWGTNSTQNAGVGTNDTGSLVLIGTETNPIVISNVVVATGDIYIKGYYTGQGALYAGRNIHVIGDLKAVNPPTWPKPDSNPYATAAVNRTRDFLGLCAKGNLILGKHTDISTSLIQPPHTEPHVTDSSDAALGYVTHSVDGKPYFDADYSARDGDGTQLRSDGSPRYFYTPMLGDAEMAALGHATPQYLDVVLYSNHLIGGTLDSNGIINGAIVCRDFVIPVATGNSALNWDIRLGSQSIDGMGMSRALPGMLPRQTVAMMPVIRWTELAP